MMLDDDKLLTRCNVFVFKLCFVDVWYFEVRE